MQFEHDTSSRKAPEPGNQASRSSFLEAALFNSPESQNFLILLLESVEKNTLKTKLKSNCKLQKYNYTIRAVTDRSMAGCNIKNLYYIAH